jgi:hypothetical protein
MPRCHSRHESDQVLHDRLVKLESPFSPSSGGLLMRPHAGAVEEGHSELDPALLHQVEQALPDAQASPANEGLSRAPTRTQLRRDSSPLGSVLMAPKAGLDRLAQILRGASCPWDGIAPPAAPASPIVRLSAWLLLKKDEQNASSAKGSNHNRP